MKIVVFGEQQRVGALEGDSVIDLNRAFTLYGAGAGDVEEQLPSRLEAFINGGDRVLDAAQKAVENAKNGDARDGVMIPVAGVKLHAPWARRRIACAGGNYGAHLLGMEVHRSAGGTVTLEQVVQKVREEGQWGFWKVPDVVAGPEDSIVFPKRTRYLDYEGEAAIVLGKRGKDIRAEKLPEYVWGVTLVDDWSIRDGMRGAKPMSYNLAKNFDGSTSMGPCIVVREATPAAIDVETRVNGELRQQYNTRDMIFSFAEILETLSQDFTFVPGDVIAGGTSAGTAADSTRPLPDGSRPLDRFLKVGDLVEISSPQIGILRNRIVAS